MNSNIISSVFLVIILFSGSLLACPPNEYSRGCGSPCDPTCDNLNPICIQVCVSRCECKPGFVRDLETKKCIDQKDCPKKDLV